MKFNRDFLRRYLEIAPAALAMERSMECDILANQPFERPVLDLGCGDGVFAAILCSESIDVGVDYDSAELERARLYALYDALLHCGGDAIPRPDNSFATIFSNSVLEHIPDLNPVLWEQYRLLKPGGRFYVTIPTIKWERSVIPSRVLRSIGLHSLAERYARFYNSFWRHYHAYPLDHWTTIFRDAGFTVLETRSYCPPNMTTLLDALTPIAAPAIVSKKILGRWIAFPGIRRLLAPAIYAATSKVSARMQRSDDGALVFIAMTK
jgi:SAM-dependent methyltransferase